MRAIIANGALYLALPPLFKINYKNSFEYAYNEKEKNKILNNKFKNDNGLIITRFKGLGEMPAEQLRETTMDINKRKLIKIILKDKRNEAKKTETLFKKLMGKKPEFRFKFIQENANFTTNLDF